MSFNNNVLFVLLLCNNPIVIAQLDTHPLTPVSITLSHSVAYLYKVGKCSLISLGCFDN